MQREEAIRRLKEEVENNGFRGRNIKLRCPVCGPSRRNVHDRSLSLDVETGLFRCHNDGCDFRGRISENRVENHKRSRPITREGAGVDFDFGALSLDDETAAWFEARGITRQTLEAWDIRTALKRDAGGALVRWAAFPFRVGGEVVNVQFRMLGEKRFAMLPGRRTDVLYGLHQQYPPLDQFVPARAVVVVEGLVDALSVWQALDEAGLISDGEQDTLTYAVYSVPSGATNTAWLDEERWQRVFESAEQVVLWFDSDAAGKELEQKVVTRLGPAKLYRVTDKHRVQKKDANDLLVSSGAEYVAAAVVGAQPIPVTGIVRVADVAQRVDEIRRNGIWSGYSTGWASVDVVYKVAPGYVTLLTGVPGVGKSTFVDNLVLNIASTYGVRTAYFSPEMRPTEYHITQMLRTIYGDDPRNMPDAEYAEALAFLDQHVSFLSHPRPTADVLFSLFDAEVARRGARLCVIDTFSNILYPLDADFKQVVNDFLNRAIEFSTLRNVAFLITVHPTKITLDQSGDYRRVSYYDLYGSSAWANKADFILGLWRSRKAETDDVTVYVEKSRVSYIAAAGGETQLFFDRRARRYTDVAENF